MAKRRQVFALGPETEEQIKLAKDKICFDFELCKSDSDVAFGSRKKYDIIGIVG